MNSQNYAIKPKIDDLFWFNYSETMVKKAQEDRDQGAIKLQNLALWLWGIYTAYAAVGFALSGKQLQLFQTILIVAASASLIAVYWAAVWTQLPVWGNSFDPRSPTDIQEVYLSMVRTKNRRLKIALTLSVLAAIMVSIALIVSSVVKESKAAQLGFGVSIHTENGRRILAVTASVGDAKAVTVSVRPIASNVKSVTSKEQFSEKQTYVFEPTDKGMLQTSIPVGANIRVGEVILEWKDSKGMKIQLSKEVKDQ